MVLMTTSSGSQGWDCSKANIHLMVSSSVSVLLWLSSSSGFSLVFSLAHVCLLEKVLQSSQLLTQNQLELFPTSINRPKFLGFLPYTKSIY